jgi:hypothetical protein
MARMKMAATETGVVETLVAGILPRIVPCAIFALALGATESRMFAADRSSAERGMASGAGGSQLPITLRTSPCADRAPVLQVVNRRETRIEIETSVEIEIMTGEIRIVTGEIKIVTEVAIGAAVEVRRRSAVRRRLASQAPSLAQALAWSPSRSLPCL